MEKANELKSLSNLCKDISLSRFKNHSFVQDLSIRQSRFDLDDGNIGQWLSLIFVSSHVLKINFKTKYHINNIKHFTSKAMNEKVNKITKGHIDDFSKEFCNLTGGGIKLQLEKSGNESLISLPLLTRWEDNVFFEPNLKIEDNVLFYQDSWEIFLDSDEDKFVQCHICVEIYDKEKAKNIVMNAFDIDEDEGEVEFL
jgi:hypothetical protein